MAISEPQDLFPLPLTAFEQFMLADESQEYPMVFYLQTQLSGVVDRHVMRLAVDETLARHPLLGCHIRRIDGQLCWVWAGDQIPEADWDPQHWQSEQPWRQSIDLTSETGLRVWGEQTDERATLTLQFHHACCDGIAAAQFLEDVAVSYARHYAVYHQTGEELPELRPLDLQLLKTRNDRAGRRVANVHGGLLRRIRVLLKYTVRYLRQIKLPIAADDALVVSDPQQGLGLLETRLDRKQTRALRDAARHHNASLNDLLVCELMHTAHQWNHQLPGWKPPQRWWKQPTWCVLVPTSLRGPSDISLPASNVVSYVFMARNLSLLKDPATLLHSVRDEMQLVHKHQGGWLFVQAIESMQKIPGLMRLITKRTANSCMSTTVLSHMGNLLNAVGSRLPRQDGSIRMGNLLVEQIGGVPPVRQGTAVAFSTMMVGGQLAISMRCCARRFSRQAAERLLEQFAARLRSHDETRPLPVGQ